MHINLDTFHNENRITTALLLAAGSGSRLLPLTNESPKCMTLVNEISILSRLVENLALEGINKLVIVTGHLSASIKDFLGEKYKNIDIEYIHSPLYKTTNNIYSLWLARKVMLEPFILIESDLVFDATFLSDMMYPDRMAISGIEDWMNGTTVTINKDKKVIEFKKDTTFYQGEIKYKTINIYSFSQASWQVISKRLDKHIREGKVKGYYETVFSELVDEGVLLLDAVFCDEKAWYEIDTIKDLAEAVKLFPTRLVGDINNKEATYAID